MADIASARMRAEEALSRVLANAAAIIRLSWSDGATAADRRNLERIKTAAADIAQDHKALRALLAALPGETKPVPCDGHGETYDEVWRDRDLLRERLDQFEAYAMPNVAAALDRVNAAEAERDEERKAHEAIASLCFAAGVGTPDGTSVGAVRALLAALPGEGASAPTTLPPQSGAIGYMAKYNASCTDGLPHGDHGLPSEHTQPAPTTFCVCEKCGYYGNVPHHFSCGYEALPIPQPAPTLADAATYGPWRGAALRVGEDLSSTGPLKYYDFGPGEWMAWALDAIARLKARPLPPEVEDALNVAATCTGCGALDCLSPMQCVAAADRKDLLRGLEADVEHARRALAALSSARAAKGGAS
jgi:hypothetical protein